LYFKKRRILWQQISFDRLSKKKIAKVLAKSWHPSVGGHLFFTCRAELDKHFWHFGQSFQS